jgi:hypothetical protein
LVANSKAQHRPFPHLFCHNISFSLPSALAAIPGEVELLQALWIARTYAGIAILAGKTFLLAGLLKNL